MDLAYTKTLYKTVGCLVLVCCIKMDRDYEEMIQKLDTFSSKAKDMKDFNEFMTKVDEIGA